MGMRQLAVFYTTNKIKPVLLREVVGRVGRAVAYARTKGVECDGIVSSWEPMSLPTELEGMEFNNRNGGLLNIVLQIHKVINAYRRRYPTEEILVSLMEHDVLYHERYLYEVGEAYKAVRGKSAGINVRSYAGLNATGWLDVKWRHHPLYLMSMTIDMLMAHTDQRILDLLETPVRIAPNEPAHQLMTDFEYAYPLAVHVNMNETEWNSHLTSHYGIFEKESTMVRDMRGWGNVAPLIENIYGVKWENERQRIEDRGQKEVAESGKVGDVVFLNCQPIREKFVWQLEALLLSLADLGWKQEDVYCVMVEQNGGAREMANYRALKARYPRVHWFEIVDARETKHYIPSVRPWAIGELFKRHPELTYKAVMYTDSDVMFRALPDFGKMMSDGKTHVSDTISYIGYNYTSQFGERYVDAMAKVCGITSEMIREREAQSGGCQYFFAKGVLSEAYWKKVYRDTDAMYPMLSKMVSVDNKRFEHLKRKGVSGTEAFKAYGLRAVNQEDGGLTLYTIQHWCTDMWCVLYDLWKMGVETVCDAELDFLWSGTNLSEWEKKNIYHDAGITQTGDIFYKGAYETLPAEGIDMTGLRKDVCSVRYVELLNRVVGLKRGDVGETT
jgi:hypothetical protein